jgi:hypothetical protein
MRYMDFLRSALWRGVPIDHLLLWIVSQLEISIGHLRLTLWPAFLSVSTTR